MVTCFCWAPRQLTAKLKPNPNVDSQLTRFVFTAITPPDAQIWLSITDQPFGHISEHLEQPEIDLRVLVCLFFWDNGLYYEFNLLSAAVAIL